MERPFQEPAATLKPCTLPEADQLTSEELQAFREMVVRKYHRTFGDRLRPEQIIGNDESARVLIERSGRRIVAGVKFAPLAGSFTQACMEPEELADALGKPVDGQIVEVSKMVSTTTILRVLALTRRMRDWFEANGVEQFVGLGPIRNCHLYKWLVDQFWLGRWETVVRPVGRTRIALPDHLELAVIVARFNGKSQLDHAPAPPSEAV